jgi:hypothetical protein
MYENQVVTWMLKLKAAARTHKKLFREAGRRSSYFDQDLETQGYGAVAFFSADHGGGGERRAAECAVLFFFSGPAMEAGGRGVEAASPALLFLEIGVVHGALFFFVLLELAAMVGTTTTGLTKTTTSSSFLEEISPAA